MRRLIAPCLALALSTAAAAAPAQPPARPWTAAWASAQQVAEPQNALSAADLTGATLRQTVRLTLEGPRLRLRISNAHGDGPLEIAAAHVARAAASGSDRITPGSDRTVSFAGRSGVIVPPGAEYLSDPVEAAGLGPDLAVSLVVASAPARQTGHPGSRTTSYVLAGDHAADAALPEAKRVDHWYLLAGVEAATPGAALVTLGDSITDGRGSTTNGNDRWPDQLAARLRADRRTRGVAVLNAGIGGNRLLADGLGPNALARFDRDVLVPPGVKWLMVLEGINDIGTLSAAGPRPAADHAALVERMTAAYGQIIERAHAHGLKVIGATLLPFAGSDYDKRDPLNERDRQAVNAWIRTSGRFDAVVDFDAVTRDPAAPGRLLPAYDTGDHLHPSPAGYGAMAAVVPLSLFVETR